METLFCSFILFGGVGAAWHHRIPLDIIELVCVAFSSMSAGSYVVVRVLDGKQNDIALMYCLVFIISGLIYHTCKVFYAAVKEEKVNQ